MTNASGNSYLTSLVPTLAEATIPSMRDPSWSLAVVLLSVGSPSPALVQPQWLGMVHYCRGNNVALDCSVASFVI